jgi:hypothetical protein
MAMFRLRPFLAVLLSLLLLGAQEAAFAHMIGHLGAAAATVASGDEGHGEAPGLSHVCTTCVSLSALDASAPSGVTPRLTFEGAFGAPVAASTSVVETATPLRYFARAPPLVL